MAEAKDQVRKSPQPYEKPRLLVFGDVAELTQMIGTVGKNDSGGGKTKTGLP